MIATPSQFELTFNPPPRTGPCSADALPVEAHAIIGYLHRHARGCASAVTAPAIAAAQGIGPANGRLVRGIIAQYQAEFPFVVCAIPGRGYFITEDPADMEQYDRNLMSLLHSVAARVSAFRRNTSACGYQRRRINRETVYLPTEGATCKR